MKSRSVYIAWSSCCPHPRMVRGTADARQPHGFTRAVQFSTTIIGGRGDVSCTPPPGQKETRNLLLAPA